jgi:hypothetical protein
MAYGHIVNMMNMVLLDHSAIIPKRFANFEALFRSSKIQDLRWTRAFMSNEKMCRKVIRIPSRILYLVNKLETDTSHPSVEGSALGRRDNKMYQGADISTEFDFSFDQVTGLMRRRADSADIPSSTYHASRGAERSFDCVNHSGGHSKQSIWLLHRPKSYRVENSGCKNLGEVKARPCYGDSN